MHYVNCLFSIFQGLFARINKTFILAEELGSLGHYSMKFRQFPAIYSFPKILSFKSFGNSWDNSYIPYL